jgi:predicted RNA-binding protein with RPS1 domain
VSGARLALQDDGDTLSLYAPPAALAAARAMIATTLEEHRRMTGSPLALNLFATDPAAPHLVVGVPVTARVAKCMDFGAVLAVNGTEAGWMHISEITPQRVAKMTDVVNEGDTITVQVVDVDARGRARFSMRALLQPGESPDKYIVKAARAAMTVSTAAAIHADSVSPVVAPMAAARAGAGVVLATAASTTATTTSSLTQMGSTTTTTTTAAAALTTAAATAATVASTREPVASGPRHHVQHEAGGGKHQPAAHRQSQSQPQSQPQARAQQQPQSQSQSQLPKLVPSLLRSLYVASVRTAGGGTSATAVGDDGAPDGSQLRFTASMFAYLAPGLHQAAAVGRLTHRPMPRITVASEIAAPAGEGHELPGGGDSRASSTASGSHRHGGNYRHRQQSAARGQDNRSDGYRAYGDADKHDRSQDRPRTRAQPQARRNTVAGARHSSEANPDGANGTASHSRGGHANRNHSNNNNNNSGRWPRDASTHSTSARFVVKVPVAHDAASGSSEPRDAKTILASD